MKIKLKAMIAIFAVMACAACAGIALIPANYASSAAAATGIHTYSEKGKVVTASASVEKQNGNKNLLTIKVTEKYTSLDWETVAEEQFSINNNAAGTYDVGKFNVYVDTKGNTQVRECAIVSTDQTSLSTIHQYDVNNYQMYSMEYLEDYKLDQFVEMGGASNDDELASFLQNVLLDGLPVEIKAPNMGCSTFTGELAGSGDRIFARNFDFSYAPSMVVKTNPDNGYASISTVNLAFVGYTNDNIDLNDEGTLLSTLVAPYIPLDGMNEMGLSMGVLQLSWLGTKQADPTKVNLPTTTMIRMVLDNAATVEEAIDLMSQYNMRDSLGANFHYQIADKSGNSVVVEYLNNEMKIVRQQEGANYHFATNFFLNPDAISLPVASLRPTYNCWRYYTMKSALEANGGVFADEQEAMDLLQAAHQSKSTWWSIVYNLETLTTMFVPARQYDLPAYTFSL